MYFSIGSQERSVSHGTSIQLCCVLLWLYHPFLMALVIDLLIFVSHYEVTTWKCFSLYWIFVTGLCPALTASNVELLWLFVQKENQRLNIKSNCRGYDRPRHSGTVIISVNSLERDNHIAPMPVNSMWSIWLIRLLLTDWPRDIWVKLYISNFQTYFINWWLKHQL